MRAGFVLVAIRLVIVAVVDENGVLALKRKGHAPVAIDSDSKMIFQVSPQGMEAPPRKVHVSGIGRRIQARELQPEPPGVRGLNARFRTCLEEIAKSLVPEPLNHGVVYSIAIQGSSRCTASA